MPSCSPKSSIIHPVSYTSSNLSVIDVSCLRYRTGTPQFLSALPGASLISKSIYSPCLYPTTRLFFLQRRRSTARDPMIDAYTLSFAASGFHHAMATKNHVGLHTCLFFDSLCHIHRITDTFGIDDNVMLFTAFSAFL